MGLAVSQVRLLALTNRKADIECQMQIDSKRKQMLTRKSTELAQIYYQKLQCNHIQYPTGNGYEDVDYNYLMGQQAAYGFTSDFIQQITTGSGEIAQKSTGKMVLTNQYGQVLVNDEIAVFCQKAKDSYGSKSALVQTSHALTELIKQYGSTSGKDSEAMSALFHQFTDTTTTNDYAAGEREELARYIQTMLKNGGSQDGGVLYQGASGSYYYSADEAKNDTRVATVKPKDGYTYSVRDKDNTLLGTSGLYMDGVYTGLTATNSAYLGNIVNYFAPMISSALQNNFKLEASGAYTQSPTSVQNDVLKSGYTLETSASGLKDSSGATIVINNTLTASEIENRLKRIDPSKCTFTGKHYYCLEDKNGVKCYFQVSQDPSLTSVTVEKKEYSDFYDYAVTDNAELKVAQVTKTLQTGLRSGMYQLAMVEDIGRGLLHKNTTLEYFTHMNYVIEKADSSEREEITAWFNKEQALISEKETYWDSEIQNLSTELNSVNTEIDSVKSLKSNAIKSVFNWGGS